MDDWHSPKPLLIWKSGGKIQLDENTISLLQEIDKTLVIPCIVGSSRTGKSFLMNRLSGRKTGFPLGNTIQSKTKGIWVWYRTHPNDPSKGLLLMDTEGLDDPELGDENDTAILCLSLLLSSTFIFNVIGKVDNVVIDKMDFVTEISKHICMKSDGTNLCGNQNSDFYYIFPHFVLVCRDKLLQLEINGEPVSADVYMERFMLTANKEVSTETGMKRNLKKMKLRKYFPKRKCFFFPRPAKNDEDMKRLEDLTDTDLQNEFLVESEEFCSYILSYSEVKNIDIKGDNIDINGKRFVHLVRIYTDAMNDNQIPCIATAHDLLASYENQKLLEECVCKYKNLMAQLQLPLEANEFDRKHIENHNLVIDHFARKVFLDEHNEYWTQLKQKLERMYTEFMIANRKISRRICKEILDGLFQRIQKKLNDGVYISPEGYRSFVGDMDEMKTKYESIANKGEMANEVLEKYQNHLRKEQKRLLHVLEVPKQKEEGNLNYKYIMFSVLVIHLKQLLEQKLIVEESKAKLEVEREKSKQIENRLKMIVYSYKDEARIIKEKQEERLSEFDRKYRNLMFQMREKESLRLFDENYGDEGRQLQDELKTAKKEEEVKISERKKTLIKVDKELEGGLVEIDNLRQRLEQARQQSEEPGFLDSLLRIGERCIDTYLVVRSQFDSDENMLVGWFRATRYFVGLVLRLLNADDEDDVSIEP